jgi:putative IMPACT (imprinted ancient) family translation regulator
MALQLTPLVRKSVEIIYELQFDYTVTNDVLKALRRFNCCILKQEMQLFCLYHVGIPKIHENECKRMLEEVPGLVLKKKSDSL